MKTPHTTRRSKALPATTETWQKQINNNKLFLKEGLYTGSPGFQICQLQIVGVLSLCTHGNQQSLQEIMFKNYYTAFLTIRVRQHTSTHTPAKWVTCLRDYCLMPDPHSEEGAQEYVSLFKHQMLCDMAQVLELRLILRQPSPLWLSFTVEELQIFQQGPKSPSMTFPKWLSHPVPCEQPTPLLEGLPDPSRVSSEVQQMWALTEMIRASHTSTRIGRFDVDGCYDLNLLSYT